MSTLSKSELNPLSSVKSMIHAAFVEWALDTGSNDWALFTQANWEAIRAAVKIALVYAGRVTIENMERTSYAEGIMHLLIELDMISGHEKAMRERLLLMEKTRANETALAKENARINGVFLERETRVRLTESVDTSVSILTMELSAVKARYSKDAETATNLETQLQAIEDEPGFYAGAYNSDGEQDMVLDENQQEHKEISRRLRVISDRKQKAITRTMELTTQLQMSVTALDQLSQLVTGLVDTTYNYANPEEQLEYSAPIKELHDAPDGYIARITG